MARRWFVGALAALLLAAGPAAAKEALAPVRIAIGGAGCLCYLPTVLARGIGAYAAAGLDAELIDFKGGSAALTAVLGGSADVVSGYYDHTIAIIPRGRSLTAFVAYDRYPGLVLVASPLAGDSIKSIMDLAGKKVGVSAPGSSTDFFLKHLLRRSGIAPADAAVVGIGLGASAVAALEHGMVDAAIMLDPAVTALQERSKDLRIIVDTRTRQDTLAVFGGEYPGGALYAEADWIAAHPRETQALADAMVATLHWLHGHSTEEIVAKMPKEMVGRDGALYLAALRHSLPMYSATGLMDPKGAQAVLDLFSRSVPAIAAAHIDLAATYTNRFAAAADARLGIAE